MYNVAAQTASPERNAASLPELARTLPTNGGKVKARTYEKGLTGRSNQPRDVQLFTSLPTTRGNLPSTWGRRARVPPTR